MTTIGRGRIDLGTEYLACPSCRKMVAVKIHTDLPERDWVACKCGYRALLNFIPILDKYGLPHGLSRPEKRQLADHLQRNVARLQGR